MADIDINKLPSAVKGLRACLQCKMIKTREQFQDGCENCNNVELRHTTPTFHGMIAMMKPRESWVSKWQKQDKLVPGMYAISVSGVMPDEDEQYDDE